MLIEPDSFFEDLKAGRRALSVVGLGYVGLPLALELSKHFKVIGFDIRPDRIAQMQAGQDPSGELEGDILADPATRSNLTLTHNAEDLRQAHVHIVAVPTPIDRFTTPDLSPLLSASATVGKALKVGDVVVYESTVYPGCTEEDCVPVLERHSGLRLGSGFAVGYSPERINPGDKVRTLTKILKIVSGSDEATLELIARIYGTIIEAGLYRAPSIRVAEAAKIIENTQRDLNISLMNELSMIFQRMRINTYEVLEAAGTKWNFLKFQPGLVGGHCIGVDPYYLTYKAKELGHEPAVILSGRRINDAMAGWIAKTVVQTLTRTGTDLRSARILVMGATFKENVRDIRNSKVADLVTELRDYGPTVDWVDPHADPDEVAHEYGISLTPGGPTGQYQAIVLAVAHDEYAQLEGPWFAEHLAPGGLVMDLKGLHRGRLPESITYLTL